MDIKKRICDIYRRENNQFINDDSISGVTITAFYMFYHYYNADTTRLDDLNNNFCFLTGEDMEIIAINNSYCEDNGIDFIFTSSSKDNINNYEEYLNSFMNHMSDVVADVICNNDYDNNEKPIEKLSEFERDDNTIFNAILLCNYYVDVQDKIKYQNMFGQKVVKNGKVRFSIVFLDELEEELSDVESPKDSVAKGTLKLFEKNVSYFGKEKSFLGFISANSLKRIYYMYSTHGLFAANLRYYVKAAKIDSQITNSIINEPENFCYYNNGIIITCDDYKITNNELELINFSIVNGGQTTNLIGRTNYDVDFPVMCKVIKNKYDAELEKIEFLSKVAEASNTQKPIKAKDLIANKPEQRALKNQFDKIGIFLQTKRGDKISKEKYNKPWQNATNDHVAQMLYSAVYQCPGAAKNSKSKLLENDRIYDLIFKNNYNSTFFLSLQHIKVAYNDWVKVLKKTEKNGSVILGLAKNCDLILLAMLGLIYKYLVNDDLNKRLNIITNQFLNFENEGLKKSLSQNDIGTLAFLNEQVILGLVDKTYNLVFMYIFENLLVPAYEKFKKSYANYSYSHFVKSDFYYYNYVVPQTIIYLKTNELPDSILNLLDLSNKAQISMDYNDFFNDYKPGLKEELLEYRTGVYKTSKGKIPAYNVFNNNQLVNLIRFMPKTKLELKSKAKLREDQIDSYGDALCRIIKKYSNVEDYK